MEKYFLPFLCLVFMPFPSAFSFDSSVKGFIALDALNFEKVSKEKGSTVIGIAVLDLKIFAEQDNMTAAIKLDLDGKLDKENNIFEEAYATYKGVPNMRFSLGKGVVRFQNLHWGAIENSYQDGGSVIGSDNQYRKISRKAFVSASYGGRSLGFINQFTLWGDSTQLFSDQNGKLSFISSGTSTQKTITGYRTEEVTAFDTNKQLGLANKFEYFVNNSLKFSTGQYYYRGRLGDAKPNYAFDIGASYESSLLEFWMDAIYGHSAKLPYESFTTKNKYEYFLQLGAEYFLNEKWSVIGNTEGLYIKDQQHTYSTFVEDGITYIPTSQQNEKSGALYRIFTYKIETALQYKLTKSAQITYGALYEKKRTKRNGIKNLSFVRDVRNANAEAYKLAASISFWF